MQGGTNKRHRPGPSSSSSSSSVAGAVPNPNPPATPEEMEEMEMQNKVNKSWEGRARREETRHAVEVGSRHVRNYESAARRYEEWMARASHDIILAHPNVPRMHGDVSQVEPWPENGPWANLVEDYMNYYVDNTRGRFGHANVNYISAKKLRFFQTSLRRFK